MASTIVLSPLNSPRPLAIDPPGICCALHTEKETTSGDGEQKEQEQQQHREVSFDNSVSVRWYNTVLGDNPSVRNGPPVSLGWMYIPEKYALPKSRTDAAAEDSGSNAFRLTEEAPTKPGRKKYRLDSSERIERLVNNGVTLQEMRDAVAEVRSLKDWKRIDSIRARIYPELSSSTMPKSRKRLLSPSHDDLQGATLSMTGLRRTRSGAFFVPPSPPPPPPSPTSSHPQRQRQGQLFSGLITPTPLSSSDFSKQLSPPRHCSESSPNSLPRKPSLSSLESLPSLPANWRPPF